MSGIQARTISKREISGRNRRMGAVLSKQEPPVQNGRVRTYVLSDGFFFLPSDTMTDTVGKQKD